MMSKQVFTQVKSKIRVPKSAKPILYLLNEHGVLTQKEILSMINLPAKTARYAIKRLKEEGIIVSVPDLMDMRSQKYRISTEIQNLEEFETLIRDAIEYSMVNQNKLFKPQFS